MSKRKTRKSPSIFEQMKHSYICYAAISKDGQSIFQFDFSLDGTKNPKIYYREWHFDPEIIADCGYEDEKSLMFDIVSTNCPAQVKKYKITVEELVNEE